MGVRVEVMPYLDDIILNVILSPPEFAPGRIVISIDIREFRTLLSHIARRPL